MIGLEITSKESGIPLFAHEFRPDTLFTDSDIRGGLITAIMRVMGETFGQQETRIVNYGNYNAILAEGEFVYGILFTFQTGPIFEKFIAKVVEDFEQQFYPKLERLNSPNGGIDPSDFDFSKELVKAYNALVHIDETKLSKLLDKIYSYQDRIFDNMIIFLRPEMSQLYTHLVSERFSIFSAEVSTAIKTLLDLSNRTSFPIENFHIALTTNFHCLMFNIFPYTVVIFVDEDNLNTTQWRIKEIIKTFVEG
ncbi:MAG: hypothetical protein ACW991_08855 [Candidatus Hodarchaeales archaeon]|jgi:hypothetical protein